MSIAADKDIVSWDDLAELVTDLAGRVGTGYDVLLAPGAPDHHAVTTDRWVVYPLEAGQ
jgi:hypothetical protein